MVEFVGYFHWWTHRDMRWYNSHLSLGYGETLSYFTHVGLLDFVIGYSYHWLDKLEFCFDHMDSSTYFKAPYCRSIG